MAAGLIGVLLTGLGVSSAAVGYTSMPVQLAMLAEQSYPFDLPRCSCHCGCCYGCCWPCTAAQLRATLPVAVLQPTWGLAYAAGTLQWLELSQEKGLLCRALAGHRPLQCLPTPVAWLSCPPGPHPVGVRPLAPGLPCPWTSLHSLPSHSEGSAQLLPGLGPG